MKEKEPPVRFNVYLGRKDFESLERLRQMSSRSSMASTIRAAIKFYLTIQSEMEAGSELVIQKKNGSEQKLRFIF